jgi:hypothetical protein
VGGSLFIAEEFIDRRTSIELFRGQEIELTTGRVLLHALGADERALCGGGGARLAATEQPWERSQLPHVRRCRGCVAAYLPGDTPVQAGPSEDDPGLLARGVPATGVDIRTAHGTNEEVAGVAALRDVLAGHDLRRWMFTDLVMVDETISGGLSHPLTISPVLLVRRPASALTTFLHEQLHWVEGPGIDSAITEASTRWPNPPPPPAGGNDARSTWLHMGVCALEYQSLSLLLGREAAATELMQHRGYSWIYGQILDDPDWFSGFLHRHASRWLSSRRFPAVTWGNEWWTDIRQTRRSHDQPDRQTGPDRTLGTRRYVPGRDDRLVVLTRERADRPGVQLEQPSG